MQSHITNLPRTTDFPAWSPLPSYCHQSLPRWPLRALPYGPIKITNIFFNIWGGRGEETIERYLGAPGQHIETIGIFKRSEGNNWPAIDIFERSKELFHLLGLFVATFVSTFGGETGDIQHKHLGRSHHFFNGSLTRPIPTP